jgi:hypothetical protein
MVEASVVSRARLAIASAVAAAVVALAIMLFIAIMAPQYRRAREVHDSLGEEPIQLPREDAKPAEHGSP